MTQEVITVDVLVVGGGGSGLAAAIAAASAGASTLLIEKNPRLGGTTGLSVGSITATGTLWQKARGIVDTPDEHFADMSLFLGDLDSRENMVLRRILVDNVTETLEWLHSIGLNFYGPMPEPPHSKPRMHNVLPNSRAYPYYLGREARRVGVDIRLNARASELILKEGCVCGANAEINGRQTRILTRRAVILASGDISASRPLKERFKPAVAHIDAINPSSTGDGQQMGMALGAIVKNGDMIWGPSLRFMAPARDTLLRRLPPSRALTTLMKLGLDYLPMRLFRPFIMAFMTSSLSPEPTLFKAGAILVNSRGERFTDEAAQPGFDIPRQPDKSAWILFDNRVAQQFRQWPDFISTAPGLAYAYLDDYRRTRGDLYCTAPTLAALAESIGMPAAAVEAAGSGAPRPLTQGPFHALGPVLSWIVLTEGGLAVDDRHRVVDEADRPITGLYAAGSAGQGGVILAGHGHHIGWAMTSGRRAGRFAAAEEPSSKACNPATT